MVNKYLLLFVASFFSLNLIAAEVNLDRIINEIPGGCSDEVIDYLKNPGGSEDIIGELITDTLTSACITHNEPEESIEMMQSVKNRIVRLEIPEDTDPNLIDLAYGMYAVTWFEPFLASGLIQEAENLFLENLKFFNQLKSEKKIKPFTEMIGRHQFLVAHYETTEDTAYFINGLRILEATIPLNTLPYDKEHNLLLAQLLFQLRVDLIEAADALQDMATLVGSISVFNKEYLNNIQEGKIIYKEFGDRLGESFDQIEVSPETIEELGLLLTIDLNFYKHAILDPISTAFINLNRLSINFPAKDETFHNLVKLNLEDLKQTPDVLGSLNGLVGIGLFSSLGAQAHQAPVVRKACQLISEFEEPNLLRVKKRPRQIEDYLRNLQILSISAGCDSSKRIFTEIRLLSEKFINNYSDEIKQSNYSFWESVDIFSGDEYLEETIDNIYMGAMLIPLVLSSVKDLTENTPEIIANAKLLERLTDLESSETIIVDNWFGLVNVGLITFLSPIMNELDIPFAKVTSKFRLSEDLFLNSETMLPEQILRFIQVYSAFALGQVFSHQMDDNNPAFRFSPTKEEQVGIEQWEKKYEDLIDYHIEKSKYLLDLILEKLTISDPLTEQIIDRGYRQPIKDLVSIYADFAVTKFGMSLALTGGGGIESIEAFRSLSEEIARHSFILKDNDLSLSIYQNQLLPRISNEETRKIAKALFESQKELNYLNNDRIILKDNAASSSAITFKEVIIKGEIAKYKDLLLEQISTEDKRKFKEYYQFDPKDLATQLEDNEAIVTFFNSDGGIYPMIEIIYTNQFISVIPLSNPQTGNTFRSNNEVPNLIRELTNTRSLTKPINKKQLSDIYQNLFETLVELNFFRSFEGQAEYYPNNNTALVTKVYIIGDGVINNLPFSALYNEENQTYLVEEFDIQYLPDEQSFFLLKNPDLNYKDQTFVGIGDPSLSGKSLKTKFNELLSRGIANSKELNKLSPLPSTGVELRNISKFFEQNKVLTRNAARESNLTDDLLKNASIISFATHAVEDISEESYEVGLVLTPPNKPTNKDDGFLTRREISSLKLNSPTVILSACNTARGLYEGADRYSGLPAGFFEAGANTLVLSRWDLETNSAREMSTLAMEIATRENIPIGSAYNQAMREFINNPEYARYSHPFYWAGFQTIGK